MDYTGRIEECEAIIAREEHIASAAPNDEAAEWHRQKAELYRLELAALTRERTETGT